MIEKQISLIQRFPIGIEAMLQQSIALIGVYDENEVLRYSNEAFQSTYFVGADEEIDWQNLMRRNYAAGRGTVIETLDIGSWISSVRSRRGKSRQRTYESDLHDGRFIWVTETRRDDGWIIYIGTDITSLNVSERKLRLANEQLFRQSFTDELTGVSNRRHILGKLRELLVDGRDAWACLVDVDHFKKINDTYGHHAGDEILTSIAQTARNILHLKDSFGRVGGEEFLVLFTNQSFEDVKKTLLQLQAAIAEIDAAKKYPGLKVTISGGLSGIFRTDSQEEIFIRADAGLYLAKTSGRNRIYFGQSDIRSGTGVPTTDVSIQDIG